MLKWLKNLLHHEQTTKKEKMISGILFFGYIFFLGYTGYSWNPEKTAFYNTLLKPEITPPEWTFSLIWLTLFACIGLAGYYAWNHFESEKYRKIFTALYLVNGFLVFLWPYLFLTQQSIASALYIMIGLIIIVELMILTAFKANQKSAYLLMPYLGWLFFLTYLNTAFIVLNG